MADTTPASLDSAALSRRLSELAGDERRVQVDFLLHLDEYDRRRAWAEAGYPSLWEWCLRVLHLREGAAGRRIAAMRVLRRIPGLVDALRDGRLCLSTLALLGPVLTDENWAGITAHAAFMTKAETEHLVASLQPHPAPREGLRLLPSAAPRDAPLRREQPAASTRADRACPVEVATAPPRPPSRPTIEPVSASAYSLRVTVDSGFKQELDELKAILAHTIPDGDLGTVLREAVRCALEKHRKRKGAVETSRSRKSSPKRPLDRDKLASARRQHIPAAVRREVWRRDDGRCAWRGEDGRRCGSTWKLELDHVVPAALGGPSTVENLRLCCRSHNQLHAEQVFGRAHMELFRKAAPRRPRTISSGSGDVDRSPA